MTASRRETLWGLIAEQAGGQGHRVSVADVCAVALSCVQVSGAWVTAASGPVPDFVICVTDPVSEQLAELQVALGEGPCHDLTATAGPVLTGGLADEDAVRRWPAFTAAAGQLGAAAVFAFPLTIGAIRAGTMGLYRSTPGALARAQLGDSLLLSDIATVLLLDSAGHDGVDGDGPGLDGHAPDLALHRSEVDQATGMLTLQLGLPPAAAFARLRAYAYAYDRRLANVAADIVARRLRLHPDSDPDRASDGTA